jgi:hypothetical protein
MADNVGYTPGSGATVAADDIGGVLYQRVKIAAGADGAAADVSSANPLPIAVEGVTVIDNALKIHDEENHLQLSRIINALNAPQGYDRSQQRQRGTVILESGTVTTVTTVTTCSTVTNLSTIDTLQGRIQVYGQNLAAWGNVVRSRIS